MDNIMIEKARSHFIRASEEFGFTFVSPYCLDEKEGIFAFGYIAEYGSYNGAVIDLIGPPDFTSNRDIVEICKKKHMFLSFLYIESLLGEYDSDYFREMLEDWTIERFLHCDTDDELINLHDCKAERAVFGSGVLEFDFGDGFWISPDHSESNLSELVRTDRSKVEFRLIDGDEYDVTVFVFERNIFKQTVRKEWSVQKLVDSINSGEVTIEFLYQYSDGYARIVQCHLWSHKKPYSRECILKIDAPEVRYYWNNIIEDRVW